VELISLQETDGKSTYVIYVDGKPVASASNAPARIDYRPQQDDLKKQPFAQAAHQRCLQQPQQW
jgi:hypothetical protein